MYTPGNYKYKKANPINLSILERYKLLRHYAKRDSDVLKLILVISSVIDCQ